MLKDYKISDFSDINCIAIEDLTEYTTEIVEQQLIAEKTGDWSALEDRINHNMLIDTNNFHRILCLTLDISSKQNVLDKIKILENREEILSAEPDYIECLNSIPNDPFYTGSNSQWGLNGACGISADHAWNITTGSSTVLVGVIDSGIDGSHPDLINNINDDLNCDCMNTDSSGEVQRIDKDDLEDLNGHGTHVAGIIGAQGNNDIGITGVAWNVKLVSLKVFGAAGIGSLCAVERTIDFATKNHIDILNYSAGGPVDDICLRVAIINYPGLFVCAAGNDDQDNDLNDYFPSNYSYDNLISVGAIMKNGNRPNVINWGIDSAGNPHGSNFGKNNVDIFAPGDDILSTYPIALYDSSNPNHIAPGYFADSGTSMATPFVTGVAALMLSVNPNLTAKQIKFTMMNNVTKYSNLENLCVSGGILDAFKSVGSIAYSFSTINNKISINGFANENLMMNCKILEIPTSFAQISEQYGTQQQDVYAIEENAFENCLNLQGVSLPYKLCEIGSSAFKGCTSLSSITIPGGVEYIDDYAFMNCSSLSSVRVSRGIGGTTSIGQNVFSGCNDELEIIVPTNRVAEYKNKQYWSNYKDKIKPSGKYLRLDLDCESNFEKSVFLMNGYITLYQLNVNCAKRYQINTTAAKTTKLIIYDSNMNVVENKNDTIDILLGVGTYYVSLEYVDSSSWGSIEINFSLVWPSTDVNLSYNTINNISSSIHNTTSNLKHGKFYFYNDQGSNFFKFKLNGGINATYLVGTITIYNDHDRTSVLDRYVIDNENNPSISNNGENEMYVYIPRDGYYYIDIVLETSSTYVTFEIEKVEVSNINYQNFLTGIVSNEIFTNKKTFSYFKEVTISHSVRIALDIFTNGNVNNNIDVYIFKKEKDIDSDQYYIVHKITEQITSTNKSPAYDVILDSGTYYIGYSNNLDKVGVQFSLVRQISNESTIYNTLITDPAYDSGYTLGSEVIFNNGELRGTTITKGFTRNIYLDVEDRIKNPMSRLEYDWYSSDEEKAKVTSYGTVLGLNVLEDTGADALVYIYAINKEDPSIVYAIELMIINDTSCEELIIEFGLSYSYEEENGTYKIELDFTNSPYPYIQYYSFQIIEYEDLINVIIDRYGRVTSDGEGKVIIMGRYESNIRVTLIIHLRITE